jgi:hypothetical protein
MGRRNNQIISPIRAENSLGIAMADNVGGRKILSKFGRLFFIH